MHLVSALTAGIKGAENGSATFTLRGTGTPTTVFRDFEGQDPVSSGEAIALDANGGAEVYVDVLTTVTVQSSLGIEVREFVAGYSAPGIELRSQSFSGQAYDDGSGQTIKGTSQPTTMQAIADLWLTVNKGPDWKIEDGDGNIVSIPDALAGATGLFVNPRSAEYGAEGDGANNDLPALDAATADAALIDGTIVLPHGIYRIVGTWVIPANVNIFGLGTSSVAILNDSAANENTISVSTPSSPSQFRTQFIEGFRIEAEQANTGIALQLNDPTVILRDVTIGSLNAFMTGHAIEVSGSTGDYLDMDNVRINLHGDTVDVVAHSGTWTGAIVAFRCLVVLPALSHTDGIKMFTGAVTNCFFDNTAVDTGSFAVDITCTANGFTSIVGNHFTDRTADFIFAIDLADLGTGRMRESSNTFESSVTPVNGQQTGTNENKVLLGSARRERAVDGSGTDAAVAIANVFKDWVFIDRTVSTNFSFSLISSAIAGQTFTVSIKNSSGGNITAITPHGGAATVSLSNGDSKVFHYMGVTGTGSAIGYHLLGTPHASS